MIDRWWDLDLRQRRVVAALAAGILVVALLSAVAAVTGLGDDPTSVRADGSPATTQPADPAAGASTTTTPSSSGLSTTTAAAPAGAAGTTGNGNGSDGAGGSSKATPTTKGSKAPTTKVQVKVPPTTKVPTTEAQTSVTTVPVTTPSTVTSTTCNRGGGNSQANQIANLFCSYRSNHGLPTMTRTSALDQVAQRWAAKMAADAEAMGPDAALAHNPTYSQEVQDACTSCMGWAENVAYNTSAQAAWDGWLGSSHHLGNIADGSAGQFGVGAAYGGGYWFFVQDFGRY